jgi:hypothetical protein
MTMAGWPFFSMGRASREKAEPPSTQALCCAALVNTQTHTERMDAGLITVFEVSAASYSSLGHMTRADSFIIVKGLTIKSKLKRLVAGARLVFSTR